LTDYAIGKLGMQGEAIIRVIELQNQIYIDFLSLHHYDIFFVAAFTGIEVTVPGNIQYCVQ
jgi:hypothetical protein